MRRLFLFSAVLMLIVCNRALSNLPPVVSNVTASQRTDGSKLVDIYYDLADVDGDLCTVSLDVSDDGGTTWDVNAVSFSGDIGSSISPGTSRYIVWDCGVDLPGVYGTNYRVKVTADDGAGPAGMVWVYINDPGIGGGHEGFNGYMSKYETTNEEYCEYLNAALDSGDVIIQSGEVYGNSGPYDGEIYYDMDDSDAQISYSGGNFYVETRDGYYMGDHPVVEVSWYGAMAFAGYYGWRLPTEWEWQAVADFDGSYTYGCGITIDHSKANYDYYNPLGLSSYPYTSPVDYYASYGYGMNDMAGNVWEWTDSCYYANCEYSSRVIRGGGWGNDADGCEVSYRYSLSPSFTSISVGFRVCRHSGSPESNIFTIGNRDVWYVDNDAINDPCHDNPDYSDPLENGSPEHPFDAIQEGIDAAFDDDTVIVLPGTYTGTGNRDIDYLSKAISVSCVNPSNPNVVAATIIDCQGTEENLHRGFYFHNGEGPDSTLAGLTITNGCSETGGGIGISHSSPTVVSCTLSGNSAFSLGGGICCCDSSPTIKHCIIKGNRSGGVGGGIHIDDAYSLGGGPSIHGCAITGNSARGGGGISDFHCYSNTLIANCSISGNTATSIWGGGGGIEYEDGGSPTIRNCLINGNAGDGIYAGDGNGTILNCSVNFNKGRAVSLHDYSDVTVNNCIFWSNVIPQISVSGHDNSLVVKYSDVQSGWIGEENIDTDPCFVKPGYWDANGTPGDTNDDFWVEGDYHLLPYSPCIDAGDPCYIPEPCETDLGGNPRVVGGRIDIGAYESNYKADLLVTSEDINFSPLPGEPNELVTIEATIWNTGTTAAENVLVEFRDIDEIIGDVNIPIIGPNDSNTESIEYTWDEAGFRLIGVTVDPNDEISELDENNNSGSKLYQVGDVSNMDASIQILCSAPSGFTEGTIGSICGTANYKILITGQPDFEYPVKGGIVSSTVIDPCGTPQELAERFTNTSGQFNVSFPVPGQVCNYFDVVLEVTDGSMTGNWQKTFHVDSPPPPPQNDLWVGDVTFDNEAPNAGDTVIIDANVYAAADNNDTFFNVPVSFYAYNLSFQTSSQIGSTQYIAEMSPEDINDVNVSWTPGTEGQYRIKVLLGPGFSDDYSTNNQIYRTIQVGPFTVSASPRYAKEGDVVQITVDVREPLPSDKLDSNDVNDSAGQPIPFSPADPCHPTATRWVYQTDPLSSSTALGRASITVSGTDSSGSHNGYGYFYVVDVLPDLWLSSCDVNFSDMNPDLGETITIDANIHADSSNMGGLTDVPVSFYAQHGSGSEYKIGSTQYVEEILPGGDELAGLTWRNAANDVYFIRVALEPGYSDRNNGNNGATRALVVGDLPFNAEFIVVAKTRQSRTIWGYECTVRLTNQSPLTIENIELELLSVPDNMVILDSYVGDFGLIEDNGTGTSTDTCKFRVDRSEEIDSAAIKWNVIYEVVDICQTMQQTSSSVVELGPLSPAGDITGDGIVGFEDLALLADQWLQPPGIPSADIAPAPDGDNTVDFRDFAVLAGR